MIERAAEDEHRVNATPFSPNAVLRQEYGRGVYGYFLFLDFLVYLNVTLALVSGISYGLVFRTLMDTSSIAALFLGLYPPSAWPLWLGTSSVILALPAVAFVAYPWLHSRMMAATDAQDDGGDLTAAEDEKQDVSTRLATATERRTRRLASAATFVAVIAAQAAVTYGIIIAVSAVSSSIASFVIALANTVLNFGSRKLCKALTWLELHPKLSLHREADTLKLFVAKFVNVALLYLIKAYVLTEQRDGAGGGLTTSAVQSLSCSAGTAGPAAPSCDCPLISLGWTFFWLLAIDVAVSSAVVPLLMGAKIAFRRARAGTAGLSDYELKDDFDVSEEYVGLLYRQFIVLLGALVFPMLTVLGLGSFAMELLSKRVKLVLLSKKMLQREEPIKMSLLLGCCIVTCLSAAFVYPQGLLWLAAVRASTLASCGFFAGQ